MFGRTRRRRPARHDEESRAHALEVVARLADESSPAEPGEINRAQLSRAAMARQATNPEQEIHPRG
jgi:hypothetical protein